MSAYPNGARNATIGTLRSSMSDDSTTQETVLEVVIPGHPRQFVLVTQSPFLIGRGSEAGNHLQLEDRRISRNCAALVAEEGGYRLEDRGHRQGVFVNGEKVARKSLRTGDVIYFGIEDCCEIIFRFAKGANVIESMLTRLGSIPSMSGS